MAPKRVLDSGRPQDRAAQRRKLGTLRDLTVQPATKKRYQSAIDQFLHFLSHENQVLPREKSKLDPLVCEYLEHLWASGSGRALACDTLAGLQDLQPGLKSHLPGAWRLLKAWHLNEVPNRAPPLPEHVLHAMIGWAFFHNHVTFGISLLLGFYTMLRTGELLGLRSCHMLTGKGQNQVLVSLGLTKGGKRQGAAESVILGYEPAVLLVKKWKALASSSTPLAKSPAHWRGLFSECLEALKVSKFEFRPYSLRRGGATFWFSKHQSMDRIMVQGRWQAQKTARIYINEGLAILTGGPEAWLGTSSGKDRLLVLDASKRHTAEEALRHPWLLSVNASAEKVHGNTVVTGFRNLAMASDFQRACLKAMAWSLSLAERRRLRGVFIDLSTGDGKDGSGIISKSHLQAYMRARIPKESDEGLEELAAMTANLPEEIHYSDFLAAMMASELDEHEDIVRCAFRHFDQEGSGNVTPEILTEVLGTDVDVSSIFREADIDQDGHISLHDFVLYLGRITELPPVETLASSEALQLEEESQPEKVTRKDRLRRPVVAVPEPTTPPRHSASRRQRIVPGSWRSPCQAAGRV
eukprot:s581_g27.t1